MEYVIIGACIVVAIAGGIVLYVKNKRTKNELGNTAVVVSKTSSSKLQASEVANDPVIQIGILPADAISDETKLVEITDSKVLAHINNLVPGLAQAGNAANNATQAVKASLKENICIDIFNRTTNIKLIDQYKAFQILSENWETITADLEMIQGEGFDAIFQVDPNMVVKKKKEDEDEVTEVQEGWKGHILPFELVQEEFHHGELFAIQSGEERLVEISNMYTEILESLEEDELEQTITNDDKNAFVGKEVKAYVTEALTDVESPEINALKNYLTLSFKKDKMAFIEENPFVAWSAMVSNKDGTYGKPAVNSRILQLQMEFEFPEESLEAKMKRVMLLMEEESELKKVIKAQKIELEAATIETIKNLDEEDALRLLELKWIEPIVSGLGTLPDDVITALVSEVENLNSKYATTYSDIEVKKESAAGSLIQMIDGLSGSKDDLDGLAEFKKYMGVKNEKE